MNPHTDTPWANLGIDKIKAELVAMVDAMKAKGLPDPGAMMVVSPANGGSILIDLHKRDYRPTHFDSLAAAWAFIEAIPSPDAYAADFDAPLVLQS